MKNNKGRNANGTGLRWPLNIHWYANEEMSEFIKRDMFDRGFRESTMYHRSRLLGSDWQKKLDAMRTAHRNAGIADSNFTRKG